MTPHKVLDVHDLLCSNRDVFVAKWMRKAKTELSSVIGYEEGETDGFCYEELGQIFDSYLEDVAAEGNLSSNDLVLEIVKHKMLAGFPLSAMEVLNDSFMKLTRALLREAYPDAFDARMNYLERLSINLQKNEISLARHYEQHLHKLNDELAKKAAALESQNEIIMEFMNLATHELQSPLWSILGFVSKLTRNHGSNLDDKGKHCLSRIQANVTDMHHLIEDVTALLTVSPEHMVMKRFDLRHLFKDCLLQVRQDTDEYFFCEYPAEESILFYGDPQYLKRMFLQLFQNAATYIQPGEHGHLSIQVGVEEIPPHNGGHTGSQLVIDLQDKGIGVEPQYHEQLFRPLERLKEIHVSGSGMGLTLARRLAAAHGGNVEIVNGDADGLCLRVSLPLTTLDN